VLRGHQTLAPLRINASKSRSINFGRHFQGGHLDTPNPGLKPWAIVYNRFAVKNTTSCAHAASI
jgi:hypothetical protein